MKYKIIIIFFMAMFIATSVIAEEVIIRPKVEYAAEGLRDPFKGYEEKKGEAIGPGEIGSVSPPALNIQGMVWGGDIHQAIINNTVVKEGDTIEEAKIIKIEKEGITILYRNQLFNLSSPGMSSLQSLPKNEQSEGGKYE